MEPMNTSVTYMVAWRNYVKTVFTQNKTGDKWLITQENEELDEDLDFKARPERAAIFIHPRPYEAQDSEDAAYRAVTDMQDCMTDYFRPDPRCDKTAVLTKRDKNLLKIGGEIVRTQNIAMRSTLSDTLSTDTKAMVAIVPECDEFRSALGYLAEIIPPDNGVNHIGERIKQCDPTVVYMYKEYANDNELLDHENKKIEGIIQKQRDAGKTVIVADTRNSNRWEERNVEPYRGPGDIAIHCTDEKASGIIKDWVDTYDGYRPKCVEDLMEPDCLDMWRYGRGAHRTAGGTH